MIAKAAVFWHTAMERIFWGSIHLMESRYGRRWNRDELLIAFNYYCQTPFGRLHKSNPDIVSLANLMGRTPDALAMKLVNFASLDPVHKARGVKGLVNGGSMEKEVWKEFHSDWSALTLESQSAREKLGEKERVPADEDLAPGLPGDRTEEVVLRKARLVQGFFRRAVLTAYGETCAMCRIGYPEIIIASHIIPWSRNERRRADPTNGLALCAFHDKVFDRGFVSIDSTNRILLSDRARVHAPSRMHQVGLLDIEGRALRLPERFAPDDVAIKYHRENLFR